MVKKLIKHEFVYYFRTFSIFIPIMLAVAVMNRIILSFDLKGSAGLMVTLSSNFMFFMAAAALFIMSIVISIVRFYQNMYSPEGYLTLTLPLSSSQHIFAKLLVSSLLRIACSFIIILSVFIAFAGDPGFDTAIGEIWDELKEYPFNYESFINRPYRVIVNILWVVVPTLLMIVYTAMSQLLLYTCITIGQLAKRNRILLAIGVYYGWYTLSQTLTTIWLMFELFTTGDFGFFSLFNTLLNKMSVDALLVMFGIMIILYSALAALFWFITQRIMTRKLNLE